MFNPMKKLISLLVITSALLCQSVFAVINLPDNLTDLASERGRSMLQDSMTENTLKLFSHFNAQQTPTFCGIASSTMILNSLSITAPIDQDHAPHTYFTQNNFFTEQVKQILDIESVKKVGIPLAKLDSALRTFGVTTKMYSADQLNLQEFRKVIKEALRDDHFVIVNFLRSGLQQQGDGHFSPVAAYHKKKDRFLILDVAQYKYHAFWVSSADLWNAVNTKDEENNSYRGLIVIKNSYQ